MAITRITTANAIADSSVQNVKMSNIVQSKNIIINGDMSIAQRATSVTGITGSGYNTIDRYQLDLSGLGTWTQSQDTDVPTGQGFATSLKMDCTTADASPAAGDQLRIQTKFEGQNLQYLKKGTSSAQSTTLSFWVKSVKTGTYIIHLFDNDNSRSISKSYTISSASTWEYKNITFPGDTSGVFDNNNATSLFVQFYLGAGSNYTSGTLNTSWNSYTAANSAVGQVNLADSTSNNFWITGVQLEAGTTASEFEFLPHDVNLQRCFRYYKTLLNLNSNSLGIAAAFYTASNNGRFSLTINTPMRTIPTLEQTTGTDYYTIFSAGGGQDRINSFTLMSNTSDRFILCHNTSETSGTAGQAGYALSNSDAAYLALSSEL